MHATDRRDVETPPVLHCRAFIYLGWLCVTVGLAIMGYCTIYLPHIARVGLPFEIYAPQLVPVATVAGVIAFLRLVASCWRLAWIDARAVDDVC